MKKLMLVICALMVAGCLHLPQPVHRVERIHVEAFDVVVVPEFDGLGAWMNNKRWLIIEGETFDNAFILRDGVLLHEFKHILNHADPRFLNPDERR